MRAKLSSEAVFSPDLHLLWHLQLIPTFLWVERRTTANPKPLWCLIYGSGDASAATCPASVGNEGLLELNCSLESDLCPEVLQAQLLCHVWCQQCPPRAPTLLPRWTSCCQNMPTAEPQRHCEAPKQTQFGAYCLFGFFKAWLSPKKTLNMGSVLHCKNKFLLSPSLLCPVTHLRKTREHPNERQQQSGIRAHSASDLTDYWYPGLSSTLCALLAGGSAGPPANRLGLWTQTPLSGKKHFCQPQGQKLLFLLLHASSPNWEERFAGLQCESSVLLRAE